MTFLTRIARVEAIVLLLAVACDFFLPCNSSLQHFVDENEEDKGEDSSIITFTNALHNEYTFSTFVCFCENYEPKESSKTGARSLQQDLVENFGVPIIVWGKERTAKLRRNIGLNSLVFVSISSVNDSVLDVVDYTLEGVHSIPIIIIYKSANFVTLNSQQIHKVFSWCWSKNFMKVALTYNIRTGMVCPTTMRHQITSYSKFHYYSPFPKVTVLNLTRAHDFIEVKVSNTYGYQFESPVVSSPPNVFLYPLQSNNESKPTYTISGTAGLLYQKFIDYLNGTFKVMPTPNITGSELFMFYISLATKKRVDIVANTYPEVLELVYLTEGSYPLRQVYACLAIPVTRKIQKYSYNSQSVMRSPLLVELYRMIVLTLMDLICYGSLEFSLTRIGMAFWFAYASLLLQWVQHRRTRFLAIHSMVMLCSFILSNIFLAEITAGFSTVVLDRQIETVDDFIQSGLKIVLTGAHQIIFFKHCGFPQLLHDRLLFGNDKKIVFQSELLNTSHAYFIGIEKWAILNKEQRRHKYPRFRIAGAELCSPKAFLKFPIQRDSPFAEILALFIMYAQESGLLLKWEDLSIEQAIEMQSTKATEEKIVHPVPLGFHHIEEVLYLCLAMWACAVLCFIVEVIWHWKMTKKSRSRTRCLSIGILIPVERI